jgi:methionine synthase I (cobalamin-dependent)
MRQPTQPFAKKGVDLLLVESIADTLCCSELLSPPNAVV